MEIMENIVWIMTGFISTLVTMEAKAHKRKGSVTKPIAMKQEVMVQ